LTSRMLLSGGITAYGTLGRAYPVHLIDRTGGLPPGSPVVSPKRLASRLPPRRSDRAKTTFCPNVAWCACRCIPSIRDKNRRRRPGPDRRCRREKQPLPTQEVIEST